MKEKIKVTMRKNSVGMRGNMDKVSIVMATYNGETYLREQIESILSNTYTEWTLEICDDGSKDNTVTIAKEFERQYPDKIKVHQNSKNLGVVLNFLEGARRAEGNYVMFCDQDDVWLANKIKKTLHYMKNMENKYGKDKPISVFTDAKVVNKDLQELNPSFHISNRLDCTKLNLSYMLMENKLIGCTVMFNQEVKRKLALLPARARVHDWWIALISSSFGKIGYLKEATLLYRQHEHNVIGNQNFTNYINNRVRSLKKQKQVLGLTIEQAREFYELYKEELPENERVILSEFASLNQYNGIKRRAKIIKYRFLKTGLVRNIGVLLLI